MGHDAVVGSWHEVEIYHNVRGRHSSDEEEEYVHGTVHEGCRRETDHVDHRTLEVGKGDDRKVSESGESSLGDVPLVS